MKSPLVGLSSIRLVDSNGKTVRMMEGTTPVTFDFSPGDYTLNGDNPITTMVGPTGSGSYDFPLSLLEDEDSICEGDEIIITASAAGLESGDSHFLTIMDHPDEECGLEIGEIADVTEGGATIYTLALRSEPAEIVTVAISSASDEVRLSSSSLVFTEMNWHIPPRYSRLCDR